MGYMKKRFAISVIVLVAMLTAILIPSGYDKSYAASTSGNWINYAASSFAGGDGTQNNPYLIETEEQLAYLAKQVNKGSKKYKKAIYKLTQDIDLSKHYWTPIGTDKKRFYGNFNGGEHTIKGLAINGNVKYAGLFGVIEGLPGVTGYDIDIPNTGFIENINIAGVKINTKVYAGAIAGNAIVGYFRNCSIAGSIKAKKSAGGVVGRADYATFFVISTNMNISTKGPAGGLVGDLRDVDYCPITECKVRGTIKGKNYVGGMAGRIDVSESSLSWMDWDDKLKKYVPVRFNSSVNAKVSGRNYVGGFVGKMDWSGEFDGDDPGYLKADVFAKINVKGTVTGRKNVGGIFGYDRDHILTDCHFSGKVKGKENTGGLVGKEDSRTARAVPFNDSLAGKITKCYAQGSVTGVKNTGGLIGSVSGMSNKYTVNKCFFAGKLKGSTNTGGIFGYAKLNNRYLELSNSYVSGSVKGKTNTGGIVGAFDDKVLRYASLKGGYVSAAISGKSSSRGSLFGKPIFDYKAKIENFYYDKSRAGAKRTGIKVYTGSKGNYAKPKPVTTGGIERKKLKGFDYKKTWLKKKPNGKTGWLPQLRVFAKSKNKTVKSASLKGAKTGAWYKVTYAGSKGKTATGNTKATKYVRYNRLEKTSPPAFTRAGYVAVGVKAQSPKKLPKILTNDKTKVKVKWKSAS
jgi:hypothetical protein